MNCVARGWECLCNQSGYANSTKAMTIKQRQFIFIFQLIAVSTYLPDKKQINSFFFPQKLKNKNQDWVSVVFLVLFFPKTVIFFSLMRWWVPTSKDRLRFCFFKLIGLKKKTDVPTFFSRICYKIICLFGKNKTNCLWIKTVNNCLWTLARKLKYPVGL